MEVLAVRMTYFLHSWAFLIQYKLMMTGTIIILVATSRQ
jgi:hypothetical protein